MAISNDTIHNLKAAARGLAYADAAVDFSPRVTSMETVCAIACRKDVVAYVATAFPELSGADLADAVYSYAGARLQSFVLSAAVAL